MSSEKEANDLLTQLTEEAADFAELAKKHSSCPSKNRGGSLGTFNPGQMVKEFNDVVFSEDTELGVVQGPVKTQFGYHLILVSDRS